MNEIVDYNNYDTLAKANEIWFKAVFISTMLVINGLEVTDDHINFLMNSEDKDLAIHILKSTQDI